MHTVLDKAADQLRIVKIGNSQGVILSHELPAKLGVEQGDVDVVWTQDGLTVRKHDADAAEQMAAAREVMPRRRDALRELSKSEWQWVDIEVALAVHHDERLAELGGAAGLRDRSMLESALARPRNLITSVEPDTADFAAA